MENVLILCTMYESVKKVKKLENRTNNEMKTFRQTCEAIRENGTRNESIKIG